MTTPLLTRIATAGVFAAATLGWAARADAHGGHHNPVAWRACDAQPLGAQCSFLDGAHARHRGTCRSISGALLCVRNRPIEPAEPVEAVVSAAPAPSLDSVLVRLGAALAVWLTGPRVTPLWWASMSAWAVPLRQGALKETRTRPTASWAKGGRRR